VVPELNRYRNDHAEVQPAEEQAVHDIGPDDRVKLAQDLPDLGLFRDDVGVVVSTWFSPAKAYEVEFDRDPSRAPRRALLMREQFASA
jgi:hypothetical protein